jgi:hypothetical protein
VRTGYSVLFPQIAPPRSVPKVFQHLPTVQSILSKCGLIPEVKADERYETLLGNRQAINETYYSKSFVALVTKVNMFETEKSLHDKKMVCVEFYVTNNYSDIVCHFMLHNTKHVKKVGFSLGDWKIWYMENETQQSELHLGHPTGLIPLIACNFNQFRITVITDFDNELDFFNEHILLTYDSMTVNVAVQNMLFQPCQIPEYGLVVKNNAVIYRVY